MMDIISKEIITSMKARDKPRTETLRYVKKLLIENDTAPKKKPELDVVIAYHKQLTGSLDQFPEGSEAIEKTKAEIAVLAEFLPKQLEESEVKALITQIIESTPDVDMGKVMKQLSPQIKGKFDGKKANMMVRELLGS